MINIDKTLKDLKIDIKTLSNGSGKKVWFQCDNCKREHLKQYRDCINGSGLCRKCFSIKQGYIISEKYGKAQVMQGKCNICSITIPSKRKYCGICLKIVRSNNKMGNKNPAWTGNSVCPQCGNKKTTTAAQCRKCSFKNNKRSGINNGRYVKDNRAYYLECQKIRKIFSSNMTNVCKKGGFVKANRKTKDILGYTWQEFKMHFESKFTTGMTWDNYGKWHIDHIKPIDWFIKNKCFDIEKVNALSNLQPLWAKDNLKKSNKY